MESLKRPEMLIALITGLTQIGTTTYFYRRLNGEDERIDELEDKLKAIAIKVGEISSQLQHTPNVVKAINGLGEQIRIQRNLIEEQKITIESQQEAIEIIISLLREEGHDIHIPKPDKRYIHRPQNDGYTDRDDYSHRYRDTERGRDRDIERGRDRDIERGRDRDIERGRDRDIERGRDIDTDRGRDRETDRGRGRGRDIDRGRDVDKGRERVETERKNKNDTKYWNDREEDEYTDYDEIQIPMERINQKREGGRKNDGNRKENILSDLGLD